MKDVITNDHGRGSRKARRHISDCPWDTSCFWDNLNTKFITDWTQAFSLLDCIEENDLGRNRVAIDTYLLDWGVHGCLLLRAWKNKNEEVNVLWPTCHLNNAFNLKLLWICYCSEPLSFIPSILYCSDLWGLHSELEILIDLVNFFEERSAWPFISLAVKHSPPSHFTRL